MRNSSVEQLVVTTAEHSNLPLEEGRVAVISEILAVWLKDANALSAKMSAPEFAHVSPITGFLQTAVHGEVSHEQ
ncbi:hypothetical protein AWB74_05895 [Caballeronia arvi]|uniref:Uncharacterized protein n=1 Tax=Caballeronia arvi TaxID=1777135 RepID=A0A158KKC9_9BURK|nr:hypothetical protein AWB74_05895 [Caballeronia arvi]